MSKPYKPGPFDQRPPLTPEVEKKMRDLLDSALTYGYATGSIGASYSDQDDHFYYEVDYRILRKPSNAPWIPELGSIAAPKCCRDDGANCATHRAPGVSHA